MNFSVYILMFSYIVIGLGSAWNQPATNIASCSARQSYVSCCGVVEKLDKILATLEVIAESKLTSCAVAS